MYNIETIEYSFDEYSTIIIAVLRDTGSYINLQLKSNMMSDIYINIILY